MSTDLLIERLDIEARELLEKTGVKVAEYLESCEDRLVMHQEAPTYSYRRCAADVAADIRELGLLGWAQGETVYGPPAERIIDPVLDTVVRAIDAYAMERYSRLLRLCREIDRLV